ncbi:sigma 54 modulation/S30EA ribosomal C-terminal domain-containing protein [Nocardia thailandica]
MGGSGQVTARAVARAAVRAEGPVPVATERRMRAALTRTLDRHGIDGARIRSRCTGSALGQVLVQVNLRVGDVPVRMQALVSEDRADRAAAARLERQIVRGTGEWAPRPWPAPATGPGLLGGGDIVRRKVVRPAVTDPLGAARALDAMDYDVHLFTDAETGQDAIVYRGGPWGIRLQRRRDLCPPRTGLGPRGVTALTVHPHPAPVLGEAAAVTRLTEHALPFLFHTDPATARGRLLYRRFDGGLGLLVTGPDR